MYRDWRVFVVVPAFNEARRIAATLASMPDFVDRVLVIDDASTDGTGPRALAAMNGRLELVRHARNQGVGAAVVTGYRRALALGAEAVVVMAGDNQMDPADLPNLLDVLVEEGADYVKGNRLRHPAVWREMPKMRLFGTFALSFLTRLSSGYGDLLDSQCGYTAVSRRALLALDLHGVAPRYGYCNDLLARANEASLRLAEVVVRPVYNGADSGIVLSQVVPGLTKILLRSGARRLWRQLLRPRRDPHV